MLLHEGVGDQPASQFCYSHFATFFKNFNASGGTENSISLGGAYVLSKLLLFWTEGCEAIAPTGNNGRILSEFRKSAIPDALTLANVDWIEGEEAIETMSEWAIAKVQKVQNYVTRPAARILEKYRFAADGGWVVYGCTVDGSGAEVPYFKPSKPRKELKDGSLKLVKYETPQGCEALPILPWVDDQTAEAFYRKHGLTPLEGETFWQVVWRCNLPIAFTEGLKKALSLIAHGIATIALRGVTCWHKKGTNELHPQLAHFATLGRSIHIIFDQDKKASTQINVRIQILKLGAALASLGCRVFIPSWDRDLGKGIDDALYGLGDDSQTWLNKLLESASSLNEFKREGRLTGTLEAIAKFNSLTYPIERETTGDYLPDLPPLEQGKIHVLLASMNSGKTKRIGLDWVKSARGRGWNILVLCPLNSLGKQTASEWKLPHINDDKGQDSQSTRDLWETVKFSRGVVLCPDSLPKIPEWFWDRPVLLVLDEGNQVIEHLTQGDTLGSAWSNVLELFGEAAKKALASGAIVLSEDGLPDRAIKFVETIASCDVENSSVRVFKHTKKGTPWECNVFSGYASGFRAKLLDTVGRGDRILFVTSSQREAQRLEKVLNTEHPGKNIVRIDSRTNRSGEFKAFFSDPTAWLKDKTPDVLILSPSAKSGVSIEGNVLAKDAYFASVWGYFPSLATDTHAQLLGRYRPSVPRYLFIPPFITGSGDESLFNPRAVKRRIQLNVKAIAGVYELDNLLQSTGDRAEAMLRIETAVLDYLAIAKTVSGLQKSIAHEALVKRLESAGHTVQTFELEGDKETTELWKAVQEEIWRDDAAEIAACEIEPDFHNLQWAREKLSSLEASLKDQTTAQKIVWRDEFLGVMFDDPDECYEALCRDFGAMRRGVILQCSSENLTATKNSDRNATESILTSKIRAFHRMPRAFSKAWLVAQTGVLKLLDGQSYSNSDLRAVAVKKAALHYSKEINYWLRLQIKAEQTPVEICNKLLKKLDLGSEVIARPGSRKEKRDKVYAITGMDNPVRMRLIEAFKRKLSGNVSPICNSANPHLQIKDTDNSPPPNNEGWESPESLADVRNLWFGTSDPEVRKELSSIFPAEVLRRAIA